MVKLEFITGDKIEECKGMDFIGNAQNKYIQIGSGIYGEIYRTGGGRII